MKRNIAFFISSNNQNEIALNRSKESFFDLANRFKFSKKEIHFGLFSIYLIFKDEITLAQNDDFIEFCVGNLGDHKLENDRYLKIKIFNNTIEVENDYAATIPVFYSVRKYLSISNIESCVMLDSSTTQDDFSYENIYGFMRYMHFIWDETAYKHIYSMLPDAKYSFDVKSLKVKSEYLKSVRAGNDFVNLSNAEIAYELNKLNNELIYTSLENYEQIILPLSSGYDSRMILAALSQRADFKEKLHCFTYGSTYSEEVKAAKELTDLLGIKWNFIDLPCTFLEKNSLSDIHNIFGSSLHMHGMYQLEFFNEILKKIEIKNNSCLTSGFMTGVPAGQHNGLLKVKDQNVKLTERMNRFSQSTYWTDLELQGMEVFNNPNYLEIAEQRFQKAFHRFDGEYYQKSVMFDVWTRQRNFIGYYPRTLEWKIPTVSPHMNKNYINFFMSISEKHLHNRLAVELMFKYHHPKISKVISNSNGIKSMGNVYEKSMFFASRVLRKLKLGAVVPDRYVYKSFDFDLSAVENSKENSVYPLLASDLIGGGNFIHTILSENEIRNLYQKAYSGDTKFYQKLTTLQSIAFSLLKMRGS